MPASSSIPQHVAAAFDDFPSASRKTLLDVRNIILEVAHTDPRIGPLKEDLRWGEPAYLTVKPNTGSTIRLGLIKPTNTPAILFNCKTSLVENFRDQFGDELTYSKNRAVLIDQDITLISEQLKICIASALKYHLRRK